MVDWPSHDPAYTVATLEVALLLRAAPAMYKALELYNAYVEMPTDRGGESGPRGRAYQKFAAAKDAALASARGES